MLLATTYSNAVGECVVGKEIPETYHLGREVDEERRRKSKRTLLPHLLSRQFKLVRGKSQACNPVGDCMKRDLATILTAI
jgi:hypothetical protein